MNVIIINYVEIPPHLFIWIISLSFCTIPNRISHLTEIVLSSVNSTIYNCPHHPCLSVFHNLMKFHCCHSMLWGQRHQFISNHSVYLILNQRVIGCLKVIYYLDKLKNNFIKTRALSGIRDTKIDFPYRPCLPKDSGGEVLGV